MESLAYIHLALAHEAPIHASSSPALPQLKTFEGINWKKFSGRAWMHLLSLAVVLGVLGIASQAWAAIQVGSSGSEVTILQQHLRQLGYFKARPSGNFDDSTTEAVIQFQKDRGLSADGIVGPQTQAALDQQFSSNSVRRSAKSMGRSVTQSTANGLMKVGDRSTAVKNLQQKLQQADFYNGPIDGFFSPATEAALKQFQEAKGLTVDGVAGPKTLAMLQGNLQQSASLPLRLVDSSRLFASLPQNSAVEALQRRLQILGYYSGPISGAVNSQTKEAVTRFQHDRGLEPDGMAGSQTLTALNNASPNDSVLALQKRLQKNGFYQGPINGVLSSQTKAAIAAAQQAYGITISPQD